MLVIYEDHCSFSTMEGLHHAGGGVTLVNGTTTVSGAEMFTLVNGTRTWRLRVPSVQESFENVLILEVKQGTAWYPAQQYVVTE